MGFDLINRIGIFFLDNPWYENTFQKILNEIPPDAIKLVRRELIQLKDGSSIKFIRANESSLGYKFNRIYYQRGIDIEVIESIILPTWYSQKPTEL